MSCEDMPCCCFSCQVVKRNSTEALPGHLNLVHGKRFSYVECTIYSIRANARENPTRLVEIIESRQHLLKSATFRLIGVHVGSNATYETHCWTLNRGVSRLSEDASHEAQSHCSSQRQESGSRLALESDGGASTSRPITTCSE